MRTDDFHTLLGPPGSLKLFDSTVNAGIAGLHHLVRIVLVPAMTSRENDNLIANRRDNA